MIIRLRQPDDFIIENEHWESFEQYEKQMQDHGINPYLLSRVTFRNCIFSAVFYHNRPWEFRDCLFEMCRIEHADFSYAHVIRTHFHATTFTDADWRGAIIEGGPRDDLLYGDYPFHLLRIGPIGSRADTLQVQYFPVTPSPVVIRTGCFRGDWATFTEAIRQKPQHDPARKEYEAALPYIQNWIRMME